MSDDPINRLRDALFEKGWCEDWYGERLSFSLQDEIVAALLDELEAWRAADGDASAKREATDAALAPFLERVRARQVEWVEGPPPDDLELQNGDTLSTITNDHGSVIRHAVMRAPKESDDPTRGAGYSSDEVPRADIRVTGEDLAHNLKPGDRVQIRAYGTLRKRTHGGWTVEPDSDGEITFFRDFEVYPENRDD